MTRWISEEAVDDIQAAARIIEQTVEDVAQGKWVIQLSGREEMQMIVRALKGYCKHLEGEDAAAYLELALEWDSALFERSRVADLLAETFGEEASN